jgi:hypothetical protein
MSKEGKPAVRFVGAFDALQGKAKVDSMTVVATTLPALLMTIDAYPVLSNDNQSFFVESPIEVRTPLDK